MHCMQVNELSCAQYTFNYCFKISLGIQRSGAGWEAKVYKFQQDGCRLDLKMDFLVVMLLNDGLNYCVSF